ncbi:hydrogenase [Labrys miyagiensis]|uniref:Hydrogenase n=1 Tax=Labrys miyagiensis TaxID=346912 RepID=A0ABQ6CTR5_9HYPH|nr:CidA/LrgA family protein [Labrys miyagiensis]GLS22375.1 hydrogenase [Labrys miyagiensis]
MLRGIAALLLFQLIGESIAFLASIPVPGPVIGMVLLFVALRTTGGEQGVLRGTPESADVLLEHLGIFFVPAGVGVTALWTVLRGDILPIAVILMLSTLLTLMVTVWVFLISLRFLVKGDRSA